MKTVTETVDLNKSDAEVYQYLAVKAVLDYFKKRDITLLSGIIYRRDERTDDETLINSMAKIQQSIQIFIHGSDKPFTLSYNSTDNVEFAKLVTKILKKKRVGLYSNTYQDRRILDNKASNIIRHFPKEGNIVIETTNGNESFNYIVNFNLNG